MQSNRVNNMGCLHFHGSQVSVSPSLWGLMAKFPGFTSHGSSLHLGTDRQYWELMHVSSFSYAVVNFEKEATSTKKKTRMMYILFDLHDQQHLVLACLFLVWKSLV